MLRVFAIAAIFALALPTLSLAQAPEHGKGRPGPARPGPHPAGPPRGPGARGPAPRVVVRPGGPIGRPGGPGPVRVVGHPAPFMFHGRPFAWHPVPFPRPWVYPPGYAYRAWAVGAILPPLFWSTPTYYYTGWAAMGLPPPDPGFQYVQYGPDLLLVNVTTGEVVQSFPGAFS
jgi:Nickel/cobalt transporter regulator